jgi:putative oxidoreductase
MLRVPKSSDTRSALSWVILRIALAVLLAAHGWVRLIHGGVVPFGEWLTSQGLPFGLVIASAITGIEIVGTVLFAIGVGVFALSILLSGIYAVGAVLVHFPAGWFVVGAGRNGMEYSVLLIICLLLVGWQHRTFGKQRPN